MNCLGNSHFILAISCYALSAQPRLAWQHDVWVLRPKGLAWLLVRSPIHKFQIPERFLGLARGHALSASCSLDWACNPRLATNGGLSAYLALSVIPKISKTKRELRLAHHLAKPNLRNSDFKEVIELSAMKRA